MILDFFRLGARNLRRRGKRSWLTVIGIVIGITAIIALFSLGQGLEESVTGEFEDLGANTIWIVPGEGLGGFFGGGSNEGQDLDERELEAVRMTRGVEVAGPMIFEPGLQGVFQGEKRRVPVSGIPTGESKELVKKTNSIMVDSGRDIRSVDRFSGLVGRSLAEGDVFESEIGIRDQIRIADTDVRVVGVLEGTGDPEYDRSLVIPVESARSLLEEPDRTDFILAGVDKGQEPGKVAERVEKQLRKERGVAPGNEGFTVSTADDLIESFLSVLSLVQFVVLGIVSIALFVGGLGIMNTMYMSVSERRKEIGIMKAMGATKRQILTVFLFESGILGLIGGIIGIVLGLGLTELSFFIIRNFAGIPLSSSVSPLIIFIALGLSFVLGVFSGFLPARTASRLEPVEAIRKG